MKGLEKAPAATLFAVAVLCWTVGCGAPRPFDHVVLVTIDTLRVDHVGGYGYPLPTSPFIDSLAASGVRFEQAISSSSHTAPSHASIFTSQYPTRHRLLENGTLLDERIPTMAGLFRDAGFQTLAVISVGFLEGVTPGFEEVIRKPRGLPYPWPAEWVIRAARDRLEDRDRDRRFFLWVHVYDVHEWRNPSSAPPEEERVRIRDAFKENLNQIRKVWWRTHGYDRDLVTPRDLQTYDSQIARVDAQLRRLKAFIDKHEPGAKVLWAITSDHGEGLGNHDYVGHGKHLYEEQIHVPLILYGGEDWRSGTVVTELVRHVDLLPTLAELAEVEIDAEALDIEGRSLTPLFADPEARWSPLVAYAERRPPDQGRLDNGWPPGPVIAARSDRLKYILTSGGGEEIYDLASDPRELSNLVESSPREAAGLVGWLGRKYEELLADPLSGEKSEIENEFVNELRSLGYIQ